MKPPLLGVKQEELSISVPSTRVYAMKRVGEDREACRRSHFSTLDSGLRDETRGTVGGGHFRPVFQYPRLGSTR